MTTRGGTLGFGGRRDILQIISRGWTTNFAIAARSRISTLMEFESGELSFMMRSAAMEIKRIGTQPSGNGPADWFTGTVRIDSMFDRPDPARVSGAIVTFEPGARTAWHTRPLGLIRPRNICLIVVVVQ